MQAEDDFPDACSEILVEDLRVVLKAAAETCNRDGWPRDLVDAITAIASAIGDPAPTRA